MTWKAFLRTTLATAVAVSACSLSLAQRPGGPGGGPGGQPSPEMRAQFQQWRTWQDSHQNLSRLQRSMFRLRDLDRSPATKINKSQAKGLLSIYNQWRSKPAMSDGQAAKILAQVDKMLTPAQKKALAERRPGFGRRGGPGGPGGPGGQGGPPPGGPGGMRPRMRPGGGGPGRPGGGPPGGFRMGTPPKNYNPLNPSTLPFPPMRDRAKQEQASFVAQMQARAKGK